MRSKVNSSNRLTSDSFLLISYKILMIIFFVSGQVKFNFGDFERKYIQYTLNSRKKEFILKKIFSVLLNSGSFKCNKFQSHSVECVEYL